MLIRTNPTASRFGAAAGAALATMMVAGVTSTANASSHREAPSIANDPAADNTDVYAWVTPGSHDKLNIIANFIPLQEPAGGPNFHSMSSDVLYEIHITRGDSLRDEITYQFRFRNSGIQRVDPADQNAAPGGGKEFFDQLSGVERTYSVKKIQNGTSTNIAVGVPVAPINYGPRSQGFAFGAGAVYDDAFAAQYIHPLSATGGNPGGEGRVFVGPRDDGFYVDLGGVFDLANLRPKGDAQDGVSGFNVHSIAIEIPTELLTVDGNAPGDTASLDTTLGIWASASRKKFTVRRNRNRRPTANFGPWVQVSRLGLPLINEAVIGLQDKDGFNGSQPGNDAAVYGAYFLNPVVVRDAEAVGIYSSLGVDPTPFKFNRTDILDIISLNSAGRPTITKVGDVLRVDIATDSQFPNGRAIPGAALDQEQVDVVDTLLTVLLSGGNLAISDNVDYNDANMLTEFPWLPRPHRGFDEGHGIPTP